MVSNSPIDALGHHAPAVRDVLIEVVRSRHDRFAEAHQVAETRFRTGFGTQWRDLLVDAHEALADRGFQLHRLAPGGYRLPVVNDCLVYVWRVPDAVGAISSFASSSTRQSGFTALPPDRMLFEPGFMNQIETVDDVVEEEDLRHAVEAMGATMPLVLVMVKSSPRQLQSIEWAIAVLDEIGNVKLHGRESIWEPEFSVAKVISDVEPFDSGTPVVPAVELQGQERQPDA